jgi:hypothetical protein
VVRREDGWGRLRALLAENTICTAGSDRHKCGRHVAKIAADGAVPRQPCRRANLFGDSIGLPPTASTSARYCPDRRDLGPGGQWRAQAQLVALTAPPCAQSEAAHPLKPRDDVEGARTKLGARRGGGHHFA